MRRQRLWVGEAAGIGTALFPEQVMRLSRMGSFHQPRLRFKRVLLRRTQAGNWRLQRCCFEIGQDLVGHAVYSRLPDVELA